MNQIIYIFLINVIENLFHENRTEEKNKIFIGTNSSMLLQKKKRKTNKINIYLIYIIDVKIYQQFDAHVRSNN